MSQAAARLSICESLESRRMFSTVSPIHWQSAADSPLTRAEGSKATVNGKLYIVGGFDDEKTLGVSKELDVYDPVANSWQRLADMPVPETHGATAVVGNDFYIGGFFYNNGVTASKLVYRYDTIANTWTQEPSLPAGRGAAGMAVLNNTLQLWGGLTGQTTSSANHWSLDLNNLAAGWVARAPLPQALDHVGSVATDGKIWSLGGFVNKEETNGNQSVVYTYDPAADKWSTAASLPAGLGHIGPDTTVAGDKIVIAGGQVNASFEDEITTVFQYDPATGQTTRLTTLPQARKSAFCAFADGKLIVACGNQENAPYLSKNTWVADYDPDPTSVNQLNGTTIGTPGSYQNKGNTIARATDGNLSTFFDGPTGNGDWVGLDLGSAKAILQIKYAPRSGFAGRMIGGTFQTSTTADFSSGVNTIYTIAKAPPSGVLSSITFANPATARYVRYLSPVGGCGNISEFEVFG